MQNKFRLNANLTYLLKSKLSKIIIYSEIFIIFLFTFTNGYIEKDLIYNYHTYPDINTGRIYKVGLKSSYRFVDKGMITKRKIAGNGETISFFTLLISLLVLSIINERNEKKQKLQRNEISSDSKDDERDFKGS